MTGNIVIAEEMGYAQYLFELAQRECEVRRANKIVRLIKASKLPMEKTMSNFDLKRLPLKLTQQIKILLEGSFVDRTENILAFGRPGSGKTHLLCAICHELARQGRKVYFTTCDSIVQQRIPVFLYQRGSKKASAVVAGILPTSGI